MKSDEPLRWLNGQVEHIELAWNFGLEEVDDEQVLIIAAGGTLVAPRKPLPVLT